MLKNRVGLYFVFFILIFILWASFTFTRQDFSTAKPLQVEFLVKPENQTQTVANHTCIFPGFGERNARVFSIGQNGLNISLNKSACVDFSLNPREYHTNNRICEYDGSVKLYAYLAPRPSKSLINHWSLLSSKLKLCIGKSKSIPLNGTINVTACIKGLEKGEYYVYIIAFSQQGWKSWDWLKLRVG
ncbi:hypothetical protein [Archaeoglobus neptunius]|uniref:hypothetical protein n=1 Tax=Archaeoglobus neptunius TaxID=2798580 RepID=UPI00192860EA|nr:hypothetical protein [Archaeoglobus neptunius]